MPHRYSDSHCWDGKKKNTEKPEMMSERKELMVQALYRQIYGAGNKQMQMKKYKI